MVITICNQMISLKTSISGKTAECLLDSGASHNFLAFDWHQKNEFKVENRETFKVWLVDGLEVPAVGKVRCFVTLEPMKTVPTFNVSDCNVAYVLGIRFLQTVNLTINWVNRSVKVSTVLG